MYSLNQLRGMASEVKRHIIANAPAIGEERLAEISDLVLQNPHNNSNRYILDSLYNNGLAKVPASSPYLQGGYFDIVTYHFKNFEIKEKQKDKFISNARTLADILELLSSPSYLYGKLGKSSVYENVARDILAFYEQHRDNIRTLDSIGRVLYQNYYSLLLHLMGKNGVVQGIDASIFEEAATEMTETKNPQIVMKIWEKIKERSDEITREPTLLEKAYNTLKWLWALGRG